MLENLFKDEKFQYFFLSSFAFFFKQKILDHFFTATRMNLIMLIAPMTVKVGSLDRGCSSQQLKIKSRWLTNHTLNFNRLKLF